MRFTQYYIYHSFASRIISNSKYTCTLLPAFQRYKCKPIYHGYEHVLPPEGTDWDALRYQFRDKFGIADDETLLLYVGRINPRDQPYKGTAELMESAVELKGKFPKSKMIMAGIGSDYDVKLCQDRGITPVIEAPQEWLAGLYLASDIYTSASKWEGFNLPLLEAQSFGRPAVAYNIGAHPEVLNDHVTGFLVKSHDEFITRIGELISSHDLRSEMGNRAAEWAKRFTWDSYTSGCEKLLEEALKEGRR
jgi:glycosyltransferase involved in cell wall biosynthesis